MAPLTIPQRKLAQTSESCSDCDADCGNTGVVKCMFCGAEAPEAEARKTWVVAPSGCFCTRDHYDRNSRQRWVKSFDW